MLQSIWFRAYYFLLIIIVIICQFYFPESDVHSISKALLMVSLGIAFMMDTRAVSSLLKWSTFIAILFSLAGDILLLPVVDQFLAGLISFLLAHLLYIFCFLRIDSRPLGVPFIRRNPWAIFLMILYGGWMFLRLRQGAGDLAWAVLIYVLAITIMLLTALNREAAVSPGSYRLVAFGAVLFVVSDSVLAWNRFVSPVSLSSLWIISSYGLAQLLIVSGLSKQIREGNISSVESS